MFEEVIFLHEGKVLLKEATQELLEESLYVSGKAEAVDRVTAGKELHHEEVFGRSKSVMVKLGKGETLADNREVTVQPMNLQKIFVCLCSGEEEL